MTARIAARRQPLRRRPNEAAVLRLNVAVGDRLNAVMLPLNAEVARRLSVALVHQRSAGGVRVTYRDQQNHANSRATTAGQQTHRLSAPRVQLSSGHRQNA